VTGKYNDLNTTVMKTIAGIILLIAGFASMNAQPVPRQSIEDSIIGWMKVYKFKGIKEPMQVDGKLYSAAQLSICDSLANWIQASYVPKGGLGDVKKSVTEKLGLYNQHTAAKPQSYGAYSKTYIELKYNSSHKLEPLTNSHVTWGIYANEIPGDWPVRDICTPTQYYFTMPTADTETDDEKIKGLLDLTGETNIKPYNSFWVKNMGFGGGKENVLLSKDNKSPFINITKGEYLQAWETAIPLYYEKEKKKINEAGQGDQEGLARSLTWLDEKIERMRSGLKDNMEKYSNRLDEPALTTPQPSTSTLANGQDIFTGRYLTDDEAVPDRVPVYRIDPEIAELCKKDKPQWILVSWDYYPGDPAEKQQHDAIINNFNFEYVYNFFFAPERVKGQQYKPLRSPAFKEAVIVNEASDVSKKNTADQNIHFFEDFSTSGIGRKPLGWTARAGSDGTSSVIANLEGLPGNWAVVNGYTISPGQLKKPLPQNFTLSYDLVAARNFTWGAKGLWIQLAYEKTPDNPESYIKLKLRPGYDGKDGEAELETKFPAGYLTSSNWLAAPGFSNNRQNNLITVAIKKNDETLQIFVDNTRIAEYEKAIPASLLFNAVSFFSYGSTGEPDKLYISNIRITKD